MTAPLSKILAIDDTPLHLMTLAAALEGEFELQFAASGPVGIELALRFAPDLILLDVMMPQVDGFETYRRLAAQATLKHIPVIFISVRDDFESEMAGLSLGAVDYISKPLNVIIARQRIRNLLERERLRTLVQQQAVHLHKLSVAVEQSPASVVITDLEACLEYVNPRFTEVSGYSAAEVLGQNPRIWQSGLTPKATHIEMWESLTHGRCWKGELINKRKNGELYWEEAQIAPVRDERGVVTHYVAVKADISARKLVELEREEALARLQKIASLVPGMVYQYLLRADGSSCFPYASDAIRHILRVTPEQVREDAASAFAILHPDDFAGMLASIQKSARELSPWSHEYRVRYDDGTVRWQAGNGIPQAEPDGAVLWHGFVTDVTQRKQDEAVFQGLFEQSTFLAGILDEQGRLLNVNSTALAFTDATREQVIGQYFPDTPWWSHPQDRANLIDVLDQAYAGIAGSFEARHPLADGGSVDVLFSATPIQLENQIRVAVFGVDITERKRLEERLIRGKADSKAILDGASDAIFITDLAGHYTYVNQQATQLLGFSHDELLGMSFRDITPNSDREATLVLFQQLLQTGALRYEPTLKRSDGSTVCVELNCRLLADGRVFGACRDISARKQAEAQRLANNKFRDAVLDSVPSQIAVLDGTGTIVAVNQAWRDFALANSAAPYEPADNTQVGVSYLGICHAALGGTASEEAVLAGNGVLSVIRGTAPLFRLEYACHSPTRQRWFAMVATPLGMENPGAVIIHTDITDQRRSQEQLLSQALGAEIATSRQQLRALVAFNATAIEEERKHIAREVHDELGQVLTALRMEISLFEMRFGALNPHVVSHVAGMRALVDRALEGVRTVAENLRPVALNMGLHPAIEWLCHEAAERASLACTFVTDGTVSELSEQRSVVLFRIVQESLTNITRYAHASQVQVMLAYSGTSLKLTVQDDGVGFDLKEASRNKSFGLLGMRERALSLQGKLDLVSPPGQGTRIQLTIPIHITSEGDPT